MKNAVPFIFILLLMAACSQKQPKVDAGVELKTADSLLQAGQLQPALEAYNGILKTDSNNVYVLLQKTLVLIKENRPADAVVWASKAILLSDTAEAYYFRANAYRFLGEYGKAVADYTTAIAKNPTNYNYVHERGIAFLKQNEFDKALPDFEAAKAIDPLDPRAFLSLGSTYALQKNNAKALGYYNQALGLYPQYYQALLSKCTLLRDMGQNDSCLSTLYRAIDYFQDSADLYKMRFDILFKKQQYNEAIIDAGVLVRLMPNKVPYYNGRGFCKLQQNKLDEAMADFETTLQLDSMYAYAWNNRGYCRYLQKDYAGAMEDIYHSLRINKNNPYAYRNLALAQLALQQKGEACQSINIALTLGFTKQYGNELEVLKKKNCPK